MNSIRKELARYGLRPRKRLGQHFLVDPTVLKRVVGVAQPGPEDVVLEVGPGLGELTAALAQRVRRVVAIEIDRNLVTILRDKMKCCPNVEVIHRDILEVDFETLFRDDGHKVKVVANLPYQISTPLIFRLMDSKDLFSTLTLMLQREVAERMVALPGGKDYSPLSVFTQSFLDLSIRFTIKPRAFFPPPNVESALVTAVWKEKPVVPENEEAWFKVVVRGCMGYRRKTLLNALRHADLLPSGRGEKIEQSGVDLRRRPGTLTVLEFVALARALAVEK